MGLEREVLVLNRLWQAVNVVNGRRALTLLYVGRGKAVHDDFSTYTWEGWAEFGHRSDAGLVDAVHGVTCCIVVPQIIQLLEYDRVPRPRVKFTRANVYLRDGRRCQYCGTMARHQELTLDHVHPRSRGGPTTWRNIVVSCIGCNARKGDRRPEEAGMALLREPRPPVWHPATVLRSGPSSQPLWEPFLEGA